MRRFGALVIVVFVLFCSQTFGFSYDILVNEAGESLILLTINQTGTHEIMLPEDVTDVKVKGALYFIEDNVLELSVGSIGEAAVLYRSHSLTFKEKEEWTFKMAVPTTGAAVLSLNLPADVTVHETEPRVLIDDSEFKRIVWDGDFEAIEARFSYSQEKLPSITDFNKKDNTSFLYTLILVTGLLILVLAIVAYLVSRRKIADADSEPKKESNLPVIDIDQGEDGVSEAQKNVIKTLSKNESLVVNTILESEGSIKRNELERKTKLAKSSLASSLHNLEQKNIVVVDKSQTVHFVKLTEWFSEL